MMSEVEWIHIFATNLKEIMEEQGYSQRDLADSINVSEASISYYLKEKKMPGARTLVNMSYELGIDLNDLMDFGDRIE